MTVVDESRIRSAMSALEGHGAAAAGSKEVIFVPGRIEVLGKHTDYAGGRSLVAATRQGLCVCFRPREDSVLRIADLTRGLEAEVSISRDLEAATDWSNYLVTVARRLASNFPGGLHGADVAFTSDLPRAAGMSSSSALVVATYLVLARVNRLELRPEYRAAVASLENLGEYLGCVENGLDFGSLPGETGVGTFGGSEDHTAILCSSAGKLRQYSYCPVRLERTIDLPAGLEFAIAVSGVRAAKTGSARELYNRASRLASGVAEAWRLSTGGDEPHAASIVARGHATRRELEAILADSGGNEFSGDELARRFEHFVLESEEVVVRAGDALEAGDLESFGELANRSQRAAEDLLGNQIPETVFLARSARELGALGASAFGAGFGGSVWALVERERMADFLEAWTDRYRVVFPQRSSARFLSSPAAAGARSLSADFLTRDGGISS